ncbi:subtilisin-like protein [Ascobolus immersus RN42]|uniref:Subtilisin-like protein n=1 Tax=Ascobolus immersus RN42 TaxID=1160509 RepID=A0A3N4I637_ASCIM|nr:subtilisin-like protein [Ascobolus immersus RN42]
MANRSANPARQSERVLDPLSTINCKVLSTQNWVGYGLAPDQMPFRYKTNPPVFGSTLSYNIARGPAANNPNDLAIIFVNLHGNLTRAQEDAHYRRMFERARDHNAIGIRGTGIVKDVSSTVKPLPNSPKWIAYYAVFPRGMAAVIAADPEVFDCGASTNETIGIGAVEQAPTWAHAAISKDTWSEPMFQKGVNGGYTYRTPRAFVRARLGQHRHLFVIDTPIDKTHPQFLGGNRRTRCSQGKDFYPARTGIVNNWDGHGTQVTILAAGNGHGVAPAAKIHPINVFNETVAGCYSSDILAALTWIEERVRNNGWQNSAVVNMSLSGGTDNDSLRSQDLIENKLVPLGVIVVHAAGNVNRAITPQAPLHPQMSDAVIVVGGMNCHGQWWGDRFAPIAPIAPIAPNAPNAPNAPPVRPAGSNWGNVVTLAAPAVAIPIPLRDGTMVNRTGTSFAAPLVSGFVLCLQNGLRQHPDILDLLMQNHTRMPGFNWDMRVLAIN